MSELGVFVHLGNDVVSPYVIADIPDAVTLRALDLAKSELEFIDRDAGRMSVFLEGWRAQLSREPTEGFRTRVVLIAPRGFDDRPEPSTTARLRLRIGGADLSGEGLVIGDELPPRDTLIEEARHAANAISLNAAYPILTSPGPDGAGGGAGAASGGDARAVVQREWRTVLGRVPRDGDLEGMLAALDRRFVQQDEDGVERWIWTPGSYVGQNDVGAGVTGAQASLVAFAQRVSEEIEPYVADASPLRQLVDNPEEVEIARSGFTASWRSFVGSLGNEGGLPVARCAVLLRQAREQLVSFGVELGMLDRGRGEATEERDDGGEADALLRVPISRAFVLTREDEERLTNFMIVRDRVAAVARAFREVVGTDAATPDYGAVFTWLQRDLDVLPELVGDVRWALDSVEFGTEQQEVTSLDPDDAGSMTLAGVLQWSEELAEEGRALLQDGGVRGAALLAERARALHTTLARLDKLTGGPRDGGVFAARLALSRVRVPIGLLGDAVARVRDKADAIADEAKQAAPAS